MVPEVVQLGLGRPGSSPLLCVGLLPPVRSQSDNYTGVKASQVPLMQKSLEHFRYFVTILTMLTIPNVVVTLVRED